MLSLKHNKCDNKKSFAVKAGKEICGVFIQVITLNQLSSKSLQDGKSKFETLREKTKFKVQTPPSSATALLNVQIQKTFRIVCFSAELKAMRSIARHELQKLKSNPNRLSKLFSKHLPTEKCFMSAPRRVSFRSVKS
ncbi:CLUMA_CG011741, isoform A [Clunio marinus]|uniref:CLUMA_CG011741, isoform A n=1 Tax=Clunio marinus TaxID=568069 RepID=A0A1J1IH69_9DIPT|nr:CLUMA_CG011741, isoform A [Clunio marinus]